MISQVEVKTKIVLNGTTPADRTVTGISYPLKGNNAVNAGPMQSGSFIYSQAKGVNNLEINLLPPVDQYVTGMIVNFKVPENNTGAVSIKLNNLPNIELKKNGFFSLDSFDLSKDQIVSAIFDGSFFQILTKLNKRCPSGFVSVNKDFCIEMVERKDTINWFSATKTCGDLNARLCTPSEWSYACQKAATLNLVGMIDNLEWIDSASNSADQCKAMGMDAFGYFGCDAGWTALWTDKKMFRCCYSK